MSFPFTKMHGAGNDFVVVAAMNPHSAVAALDWATLAPALCRRRVGVGADGVLVALPSDRADLRMRMFNPDGTEDECGNGLRCMALYAARRGLTNGRVFRVETLGGVRDCVILDGGRVGEVAVSLGVAGLRPEAIPALFPGPDALGVRLEVAGETLLVHSVSTGTAHTVIFDYPTEERFARLSPLLEHHPAFPERTSVMWTEIVGPDHARVRIWERGAGETLACGTGAAAVALVSHRTGRTGPRVAVASRGGTLTVEVAPDLALRLTGPAAEVCDGVWQQSPR